MSDRVLRSHSKRARQNLIMATGQKDMPDQGQNQAMYVLPSGLSMPMANLTPKIIRFCEGDRFETLKGKRKHDSNLQMMDREKKLRLEVMNKYYKLMNQHLDLKSEQILGRSISEDIRQELEKEIANAKLADDFVRDKPIDDFILLKQTGEYCSMLKELETLETSLICILLSASRDVHFDKRMICFLSSLL